MPDHYRHKKREKKMPVPPAPKLAERRAAPRPGIEVRTRPGGKIITHGKNYVPRGKAPASPPKPPPSGGGGARTLGRTIARSISKLRSFQLPVPTPILQRDVYGKYVGRKKKEA